jgi:hypothetical protein
MREPALVALNVVVLVVCTAWAVLRLRPEPTAIPTAVAGAAPKRPLAMAEIRTDQIEAQPLFHRSRRPPNDVEASTGAAPVAPPAPPPRPVLLGIAGSVGQLGALLEDSSSSKRALVQVGQKFEAWSVLDVGARRVRLRAGDTTIELILHPGAPAPLSGAASGLAPS